MCLPGAPPAGCHPSGSRHWLGSQRDYSEGPGRLTRNRAVKAFLCFLFWQNPFLKTLLGQHPMCNEHFFAKTWRGLPRAPLSPSASLMQHTCWRGDATGAHALSPSSCTPPDPLEGQSLLQGGVRGVVANPELISLVLLLAWPATAASAAAPEQRLWRVRLLVQSPLPNRRPAHAVLRKTEVSLDLRWV